MGRSMLVLLVAVALAGCVGDDLSDSAEPVEVGVFAAARDDGAVVVDVRTPEETAEGIVPGALLMPVAAGDFAEKVAALDPAASYAIYCRTENRSAAAREKFRAAGITEVIHLRGGFDAWVQAGHEFEVP